MVPQSVSGAKIRKSYDVSSSALRNWAVQGKIRVIRSHGGKGKRLHCFDDFKQQVGLIDEAQPPRRHICYGRVSSAHQHADLVRQCEELRRACSAHELLQDTASGLNWKRPGLVALLNAVCAGSVSEVVVTHRDRLARIGVEILEWLFTHHGTNLVVHDGSSRPSETEELRDDLLAVVTFFVARDSGRRAAANRKRRREAGGGEEEDEVTTRGQDAMSAEMLARSAFFQNQLPNT